MNRSDELRKEATECLTLARNMADTRVRLSLLTMAQKLFDVAGAKFESTPFDDLVQDFNNKQMSRR